MSRLRGFDGMRALACIAVLVHHLVQRLQSHDPLVLGLHAGELGVSLFFVLSGGLLAYPFWRAHLHQQALPRLSDYALRRAARIVPAYYLVLLCSFALNYWLAPHDYAWSRLLAGLTFTAPYHYVSFFSTDFNGPLWSIGLEVSCYALLPLLLWPLLRSRWHGLASAVLWGVGLILLMQLLHALALQWFMTDTEGKGWQYGMIGGAKQWLPYWNVAGFMGQFLCGGLAAALIAGLEKRRQQAHWGFDLLALACFSAIVWASQQWLISGTPNPLTGQPYLAPLAALLFAAILLGLHFSVLGHRLVDNRLFRHIATLSFGIYLWHYLLIEVIRELWVPQYHYMGIQDVALWWQLSAIVVVLSWSLAAFSFYLFEQPILERAKRWKARSPLALASTI
ncbi:acyltransferase family protein [Aliagarivorans marinus]|uniref:acyltransferase family protein n=1 Tax=Aliagarivorans marinus TaxID=561965 RepID=UPI000688E122|nr:acyltransferase [Aliagarivorans marinus]